jgi:flagellar hook-associated protein 1 FlgK
LGADLFSIGSSSLRTSKKALATTSHNIANANTEGYSRQVMTATTNSPVKSGSNVYGTGVHVKSVKREHDKLVEKKLNTSLSNHQFDESRSLQLSRVEEIFNEINSDGMNKVMNRFFNTFRELSNQPENEVVRAMVRDNANIVVKDFKRMSGDITAAKEHMESQLKQSVVDINTLSTSIASLNVEIARIENGGGETGDLRDQRDSSIRQIAEFFEINTYEDGNGQHVVNIVGAGSLVAGGSFNELKSGYVSDDKVGSYKGEGRAEIFFVSKSQSPMTDNIKKGSIGALLKTRNEEVTILRNQLDELSHGLVHATNAIHRRGFVNKQLPTDQNGNVISDPNSGKITGINFFKEPLDLSRASQGIELSDEVKADLNNISTGLAPNSPGDNRIAIAISKLQHEKILGGGTKTFEENFLQSVGKIGLSASKSRVNLEQSGGILTQAQSLRERISGVSIDEETTNMIKYQHSYDASAKMIKAADEMFDTVIGMIR